MSLKATQLEALTRLRDKAMQTGTKSQRKRELEGVPTKKEEGELNEGHLRQLIRFFGMFSDRKSIAAYHDDALALQRWIEGKL